MPTILRIDNLRVTIYPNDHPPPHTHVLGPDGEAIFFLNCPDGPPDLREAVGFNGPQLRQIGARLAPHIGRLCAEWERVRGNL
jgi:hypothetical protein